MVGSQIGGSTTTGVYKTSMEAELALKAAVGALAAVPILYPTPKTHCIGGWHRAPSRQARIHARCVPATDYNSLKATDLLGALTVRKNRGQRAL